MKHNIISIAVNKQTITNPFCVNQQVIGEKLEKDFFAKIVNLFDEKIKKYHLISIKLFLLLNSFADGVKKGDEIIKKRIVKIVHFVTRNV